MIYYIELSGGRCGLSSDTPAAIRRREGTANVESITPATPQQIAWVRAMGGYVPEDGASRKQRQHT